MRLCLLAARRLLELPILAAVVVLATRVQQVVLVSLFLDTQLRQD
jgi:hypothetical protein